MFLIIASLAAAQAAPVDHGCIVSGMTAGERAAFGAEIAGPEEKDVSDEALEPLVRAGEGCAKRHRWTDAQTERHTQGAIGAITREHAGAALKKLKIDPGLVDRWFAAQSSEMRIKADYSDADTERLASALARGGVPLAVTEANADAIGVYLGSLIILERTRRGLSLD